MALSLSRNLSLLNKQIQCQSLVNKVSTSSSCSWSLSSTSCLQMLSKMSISSSAGCQGRMIPTDEETDKIIIPRDHSKKNKYCYNSLVSRKIRRPQVNTIQIPEPPPKILNINTPDKFTSRLPIMPRIPTIFEGAKIHRGHKEQFRMMGEETVHNDLILDQYAVIAVSGGKMNYKHFEAARALLFRKFKLFKKAFAYWRVDPPYKPYTRRGAGKKHGGGKGPIKYFETPVKAGRVIIEVGGDVSWDEIRKTMQKLAVMMPMECIAVDRRLLDKLNEEEARIEKENSNPISFEWLIRNNIGDCHMWTSPRDRMWFGKFCYVDQTLNRKWNIIRKTKYKGYRKN